MKAVWILSFFLLILIVAASCRDKDVLAEASGVTIHWEVESNFLEDDKSRSKLIIRNNGERSLGIDGWALYFNFLRIIDYDHLPDEIQIRHINGDFFELTPGESFQVLGEGEEFAFSFDAFGPLIKEIDAPAGFYIVYDDGSIETVSDVTIGDFTREEQIHRNPDDRVEPAAPDQVFRRNAALTLLPGDDVRRIVPTPIVEGQMPGAFTIHPETEIHFEDGLGNEAQFLAAALESVAGFPVAIANSPEPLGDGIIILRLGDLSAHIEDDHYSQEAYRLEISDENIEITGASNGGVFYGIQSFRMLLPPQGTESGREFIVDGIAVVDAPRFRYRGLHLDVARNFQPVNKVEMLLDLMSMYKLNTFHFHLTDDEGWRLESKSFPELTEIGARRGHTTTESDRLFPSYGSGPDPEESAGSGWYSTDDYVSLLRFANERHIRVIPEIDVPGHARAALVAMQNRYEKLLEAGETDEAERYRIHDPGDTSEYRSIQNWNDNVINVCQESTYRFLEIIFDELIAMHEEADAPLISIHIGGDEVPHGVWVDSPECEALISDSDDLDSADQLQIWFFSRLEELLSERGLIMSGWEEIALIESEEPGRKELNPGFAGSAWPYVWSNIWGIGTEEYAYQLANAGYEVVMSHASNFYFDLAYSKDPEEAGYYWAGFVDTRSPYRFIAFDLYKNAEADAMGNPIEEDAYRDAEQLTKAGRANILGIQGQLWGETLRSEQRVDYMAFPRVISLAERAWAAEPGWSSIEDRSGRNEALETAWNEFANRLGQRELPRLDALHGGIAYRLPPPGAVLNENRLEANIAYPGLEIRYTTDGSQPGPDSEIYYEPVDIGEGSFVRLRSFSTTGRGSRTVSLQN